MKSGTIILHQKPMKMKRIVYILYSKQMASFAMNDAMIYIKS